MGLAELQAGSLSMCAVSLLPAPAAPPCAGCRDVLPKEGGTCAGMANRKRCSPDSLDARWTDPGTGQSRLIGAYWCPATCGRCSGDDPQWRSLKPLGNTANPSIIPTVFSVGNVTIAVYKSAGAFTSYIKGRRSPPLHAGPYYTVSYSALWHSPHA